jgi:hypothetical protein
MVMELLEEEKKVENLLGFSCAGSLWICNKRIHKWTCQSFFFSFLFRHAFGFFRRYSHDKLKHHTRLNLNFLYYFFFGFLFFF